MVLSCAISVSKKMKKKHIRNLNSVHSVQWNEPFQGLNPHDDELWYFVTTCMLCTYFQHGGFGRNFLILQLSSNKDIKCLMGRLHHNFDSYVVSTVSFYCVQLIVDETMHAFGLVWPNIVSPIINSVSCSYVLHVRWKILKKRTESYNEVIPVRSPFTGNSPHPITLHYSLYLIPLYFWVSAESHHYFKPFSSQAGSPLRLRVNSCLQLIKNRSVLNNCFLRWFWYWYMCSIDSLFICWHIWQISCSSLVYSWFYTMGNRMMIFIFYPSFLSLLQWSSNPLVSAPLSSSSFLFFFFFLSADTVILPGGTSHTL